jgi:hypothetical protein
MTLKTAVKLVEDLQAWRAGDDITHMQDPAAITEAIECLLAISNDVLRNYEANQ